MLLRMIPPHNSLVKYDNPILVSTTKDKKGGGSKKKRAKKLANAGALKALNKERRTLEKDAAKARVAQAKQQGPGAMQQLRDPGVGQARETGA